jgi:acetyltransferase-like isoleucine patch superfamily enzyme
MIVYRPMFATIGRNVWFDPSGDFSYATIHVGSNVYLGIGTRILASETSVHIGDKVMFGPGVSIIAGDHNTSVIGKEMIDVKEKLPENDQPVVIESDVWVGANAVILKGVTIGKGSIIASGSVVAKSFPNYSIIAGVPAKLIRARWTSDQIKEHEAKLGHADY